MTTHSLMDWLYHDIICETVNRRYFSGCLLVLGLFVGYISLHLVGITYQIDFSSSLSCMSC